MCDGFNYLNNHLGFCLRIFEQDYYSCANAVNTSSSSCFTGNGSLSVTKSKTMSAALQRSWILRLAYLDATSRISFLSMGLLDFISIQSSSIIFLSSSQDICLSKNALCSKKNIINYLNIFLYNFNIFKRFALKYIKISRND